MDGRGVLALTAALIGGMFLVLYVGAGLLRRVVDGDGSALGPLVLLVSGAVLAFAALNAWLDWDTNGGSGGSSGGGGGGGTGSSGDGGDGGGDGGG
ncbi:hypothetical protein [Nocardiopsis sp. L17-MgMaSL7]|uniref:hypothetical protein n=1 Tax=Nocardiopsis sp. L17-MgMaSL7 TaxID=1938893 RepID=UPI000D718AB6|nr:hypothetical protein [Nocardiopsis sp. L17-MgMaSL7]PWV50076.1 hypothetical protein BDW27_108112 [Nocardiopsis sp. L17-MgMaSL7]